MKLERYRPGGDNYHIRHINLSSGFAFCEHCCERINKSGSGVDYGHTPIEDLTPGKITYRSKEEYCKNGLCELCQRKEVGITFLMIGFVSPYVEECRYYPTFKQHSL